MSILRLRIRNLALLFFVITFTMFLFSYTLWDPSLIFFKPAVHPKRPCSCRHCLAELEDAPWNADHFNRSIHPLMTRENSVLSEETYKWWQSLQSVKKPANYSEVVEELFQIIPDEVLYMDARPERCRTCSVVGNSGNLKGSKYGDLIDSSKFIFRMNMAPTSGFEEDVGTRTTHHFLYPESAIDLDYNTRLVLIPYKTLDLQWIISALTTGTIKHTYLPVVPRIKANRDKVLIYNPTFFKYVYDSWLEGHGRYPSTGFLSLVLALHICDEVSVFGFGADQSGSWHHYWENNNMKHSGVHDGDYEHNLTMLLVEKHKIKMFHGT